MLHVIIRIVLVSLFVFIFYFLMNMGRQKDKYTKQYFIFSIAFLGSLFLIRAYPVMSGSDKNIFLILKTIAYSIICVSVNYFGGTVLQIASIKKIIKYQSVLVLSANMMGIFVFLLTGCILIVKLILIVVMIQGSMSIFYSIFRFLRLKDVISRQQRVIIFAFPLFMFHGFFFVILEIILNKKTLPLFQLPGTILITGFYVYEFFSNLRWKHKMLIKIESSSEKRHIPEQVFENKIKTKLELLPDNIAQWYYKKLIKFIETEKLYLDAGLTLALLSEKTGISRNHLSYVINKYAETNFYGLINKYRINIARKLLSDPARKDDKIIDIAYGAGYVSLATFYRTFKKATGISPQDYRKMAALQTRQPDNVL